MKVVRGGSRFDSAKLVGPASRWRYEPYKPVFNVGFRVLVELKPAAAVTTAKTRQPLSFP